MSTNIEARALADILYDTIGTHEDEARNRELAAEARAGGRLLTKTLAEKRSRYGQAFVDRMAEDTAHTWHYQIDPSGSYIHGDERREPEARASWARIARDYVEDDRRTRIYLEQAEAMVSWPIYRAALAEEPHVAGFMAGGANERANYTEQDGFLYPTD